ncbi:hypothetical protein JW848_10500 [Candidatus Bipolaricaulota bacterium]|nr:hypothetical protein [Candidatus Bipolaricaulota bacterium]
MPLTRMCDEARLAYWSQLLRGESFTIEDLDREILPLVRGAGVDERKAYTLLRACCELASCGSSAVRRNLKVAILYWFSNMGNGEAPSESGDTPLAEMDLHRIIGMKLSWREAAAAFGANPNDYSAYHRLLSKLKERCDEHWRQQFGLTVTSPFGPLGDPHGST